MNSDRMKKWTHSKIPDLGGPALRSRMLLEALLGLMH